MSESQAELPPAFQKLAISNLMAQSAEQEAHQLDL